MDASTLNGIYMPKKAMLSALTTNEQRCAIVAQPPNAQ